MANIVDPLVAKVCNEELRVIADAIERLNRMAPQAMLDIVVVENRPSFINANNADIVLDGSETDGRKPVTKENILQLKFVIEQLQSAMNESDRAAVVHRWAVNSVPLF
jgi:hypothetical protein